MHKAKINPWSISKTSIQLAYKMYIIKFRIFLTVKKHLTPDKVTGTKKNVTNRKVVTLNPFYYAYNYYFRSKKITVLFAYTLLTEVWIKKMSPPGTERVTPRVFFCNPRSVLVLRWLLCMHSQEDLDLPEADSYMWRGVKVLPWGHNLWDTVRGANGILGASLCTKRFY